MNHFQFANLPTPIHHLERLGEKLGYPDLYMKRDDLTGLEFGGNKTRKLEYVMYDAIQNKAGTIVTVGGMQSNHVRQTAAICARYQLKCILILNNGDEENIPSGNLYLNYLFEAEIITCAAPDREETVEKTLKKLEKSGEKAYYIPLGASTMIGAYSYKNAFEELHQQIPDFDWIFIASGSGGTQAGLIHGAHCAKWSGKIYGVSILFNGPTMEGFITPLLNEMAVFDGVSSAEPEKILVDDGYLGGGYGVMGALEKDAILNFAREEGILLDPVYTGRAAGAMLDLMTKGIINPDEKILFWHTGGTPALFCEKYRKTLLS